MSDVFAYLNTRKDSSAPGPIPQFGDYLGGREEGSAER
jgi:hypothetical protein